MPPSDIVLLLLGLHGSGKSTFVKAATKENVQVQKKGDVNPSTKSCKSYGTTIGGRDPSRKLKIIDTPGLADTETAGENLKVLQQIANELRQLSSDRVSGVIYFHNIEPRRLSGVDLRNFKLLVAICGPQFFRNVAFVTTRWDCIGNDHLSGAEKRNLDIEKERASLLPGGPRIFKFLNDGRSHEPILQYFVRLVEDRNSTPPLQFTRELEQYLQHSRSLDKAVERTTAGQQLKKAEIRKRVGPGKNLAVLFKDRAVL
ncbi:P-loop containing nucleoside triphosphate hydrolase protein [Echria macrotheca]|uniref:P-loop containing nucleoside triphosphate hydrolase protein n=1 Tax=Echria macrotheca TaxID=438768 RepID=A0AAJ0F2U2_9PEZI|nr:P-loop containing nucleoside triphosphate hydrolase protein [Echria macrotheca]